MNKDFPLRSYFDRASLIADYKSVQSKFNSAKHVFRLLISKHIRRERELRYVIEAPSGMHKEQVEGIAREFLIPEILVEALFEDIGENPVPEDLINYFLLIIPGITAEDLTQNPYEISHILRLRGGFLSVEPDIPYLHFLGNQNSSSQKTSSAPPSDKAWSLRNIRAEKAWTIIPAYGNQDGKGITIGHLDSGWTDHDDLDQVNFDHSRSRDYIDPSGAARDPLNYHISPGHGTRTGSVIMSRGDVTLSYPPGTTKPGEITGVARKSTYVPVRCIKSVIIISNSDIARAVRYITAIAGDVISMSLGGRPLKALHLAIKDAVRSDVIVVCAAGNHVKTVVWPARYPETLAVAANNISDQPWRGSSRGRSVDITAPGEDVWVAEPSPKGDVVNTGSGTSYATATLAGVAALWLAFHGKSSLIKISGNFKISLQEAFRSAIKTTARVPTGWDKNNYGAGIVDAEELLKCTLQNAAYDDVNTHGELINLIDENNPQNGKKVLYELFNKSTIPPADMLDFFCHELCNLLLDNIEILDLLRDSARNKDFLQLSKAKILLKEHASETLWKAAGW